MMSNLVSYKALKIAEKSMSVKTAVAEAFAWLGYSITPKWRESKLALANLTTALLDRHAVDCVVDVGANEGQYRNFIRLEVGFSGHIISFEPQPKVSKLLLASSLQDAKWDVHNFALGAEETELKLNIMNRSVFSSFHEPDNTATPQFEAVNQIREQCLVPVRRLDALKLTEPASRIFLKCDTQGFDMDVIRGAEKVLDRVVAIQLELSLTRIYKGLPKYFDVLKDLDRLGFQPAGFFPVSENANGSAIEFDCILVNMNCKGQKI